MKKHSKMLLISSILMVIANPVAMVWSLGLRMSFISQPSPPNPPLRSEFVLPSLVIPLVIVLISVIVGVLGIIFWRKPKRAGACAIAGILILACNVFDLAVIEFLGSGAAGLFFFFGFPIPIIYMIAAGRWKSLSKVNSSEFEAD